MNLDFFVKLAQVVQGFATPAIAVGIGIITFRIQQQQIKAQQQQAETHHLQYRFGLIERRMKVFDATMEFIAVVLADARVETIERPLKLLRDTREHHLLFGAEIGEFIDDLYKQSVRLHTISQCAKPHGFIRLEDIETDTQLIEWFSKQADVARAKFLKYLDFRQP